VKFAIVLEVISGIVMVPIGLCVYQGVRRPKAAGGVDRLIIAASFFMLVLFGLYALYMAGNGYMLVRGGEAIHISQ
jgi:hypothetical protein